MVKVFRSGVGAGRQREPEDVLLSDVECVRVAVENGHLFLFDESEKIIHVLAPGSWVRAEVL